MNILNYEPQEISSLQEIIKKQKEIMFAFEPNLKQRVEEFDIDIYEDQMLLKEFLLERVVEEITEAYSAFRAEHYEHYLEEIVDVFNFLIETVVDCGKIQTKAITRALNNYYEVASNSFDDEKSKNLFKKVLDGYSESGFYDYHQCLSEEGIADFLTISGEGKALVDEMEEYNKKEK